MSLYRQAELTQWFFNMFKGCPYVSSPTVEVGVGRVQMQNRAKLLRYLNAIERAGYIKPLWRRTNKHGLVTVGYAVEGIASATMYIWYLPSQPGVVFTIKQAYHNRNYGHRINASGLY